MFKQLLQILMVQLVVTTLVATCVAYFKRHENFYNMLRGNYNNSANTMYLQGVRDNERAVQMSVQPTDNGQTFNLQLDSSVRSMNISTASMNARNHNEPPRTFASYMLSGTPSITYGVPVSITDNATVYGDITASKNVSAAKVKTPELAIDNGWTIGASAGKNLTVKRSDNSGITLSDSGLHASAVNAGNVHITNPFGCTAKDPKACTGIRLGAKTSTDDKGENAKVIQTIDADYIELKNNKLVGKDTGEVIIGNFTMVEDHPGRLSVFYKRKRVLELDATGSRATDLYLYNQDNNENYVYMSSATKTITKNVRSDERD